MWREWLHYAIESTGTADAYRPVLLDDTGKLDDSFLPLAVNGVYLGNGGGSGIQVYESKILLLKGSNFTLTAGATYAMTDKLFGVLVILNGTSAYTWVGLLRGGGNAVVEWWNTGSTVFNTTKDTADRINIYYDAGTSKYTIQNKKATTQSFYISMIGA